MPHRRVCVLLVFGVVLTGCDSRPSAPPLQDGPVYSEPTEGFRFFVPEGWKQRARGSVPPGRIESERMLVEYKCITCTAPGTLLVTVADVPLDTPLTEYVTKSTLTDERWRLITPAQEFTINNVPAARIIHAMNTGADEVTKETVAIRRGERVYFFKGSWGRADEKARQAIRTAIDTIVW
ncbi:MAG: hypothetical protein EXR98_11985 [Gemmataceae bacterium]|nr:hypothetical protein [Gemmataceae bacterium]